MGSDTNFHQHWDNDIESFSVFGSDDYQIKDQWTVSGEVRDTDEDREAIGGNLQQGDTKTGLLHLC